MFKPTGYFAQFDAKDLMRLRVLNCIRVSKKIPRIEIARQLDASPATVSAATAALIERNLIREDAVPQSMGAPPGRPRVMLEIQPRILRLAGVHVSETTITVMIVDFSGAPLATHSHARQPSAMTGSAMVKEIAKAVESACAKEGIPPSRLAGIGIGIPGAINGSNNIVYDSLLLAETDVEMGPLFAQHLPAPAFIDNETNLVTKSKLLDGVGVRVENFIVVTMGERLGLGVVVNGELYRGAQGRAGNLGHLILAASDNAPSGETHSLDTMLHDARIFVPPGDGLTRARQQFTAALANLVMLFDPKEIIVCGTHPLLAALTNDAAIAQLRTHVAHVPELICDEWHTDVWAKGAADYAIKRISERCVVELDRIA